MKKEQATAAAAAPKKRLEGMVIVFSGTLSGMRPMQAKKRAEELGARVSPFLSAGTTFLVVGNNAVHEAEAKDLGVRTINEDQWNLLINPAAPMPAVKPARPKM